MSYPRIYILSIFLICGISLFAVNDDAGTTGFNTFKLAYSARGMAMANAMTAIINNPDGINYNPAAILNLHKSTVSSTWNSYLVETQAGSIQGVWNINEFTAYGATVNYLDWGSMEKTEITSNNEYLETGETFGARDFIVGLSWAQYINSSIDFGGTLKFVHNTIDTYNASAIALDAGIIHHPLNEKIKVGLVLRNLGLQLSYYTDENYKEELPLTFAAGLSYQISKVVLAAFDLSKPTGQNMTGKLGFEYAIHPLLDLRAGYTTNAADWQTGGSWDWSSGMSFGFGTRWKKCGLDYGISSYGDLGFVNQVTLKYHF